MAPDAPTADISGEPKILAPNSVVPKKPERKTVKIAANNPDRM